MNSIYFLFLSVVILTTACTQKSELKATSNNAEQNLATRGKKVYSQNCIACHNPNPKIDGAIGPAIADSSIELLTARLLHANYPVNYKPKKSGHQMPALPALELEIPALFSFLKGN